MPYADEQSYEEMISALQTFLGGLEEQCNIMEAAGTDCVDNTEGDNAAKKANAKLQKCISGIRSNFESIQQVIQNLQQELDDIIGTNKKSDQFDD